MVRELDPDQDVEKSEFVFSRHFMGMSHNYCCAVCKEQSAVQDCSTGILQPCWDCQTKKGYVLVKLNRFLIFLAKIGGLK